MTFSAIIPTIEDHIPLIFRLSVRFAYVLE